MVPSACSSTPCGPNAQPARPDDQLAVLISCLRSVLVRDRIGQTATTALLRCDWLTRPI